jgi:ribosomal protein S18 acetylase RimI-like enzyme
MKHQCRNKNNNTILGDINIRQATLDDTHHIAKIKIENHRGASPHPLEHILNEVFIREYTRRWEKKFHNGELTLILSVAGKTCGLVSYTQSEESHHSIHKTAEITNIYVVPELRGHRLGRLLCKTAMEKMRENDFKKVLVWIVEGRDQTRKFYEAMGFCVTSAARLDKIDDNVMLKEIKFEMQLDDHQASVDAS